jgi:uncharacterized membrane protein YfcA
MFIILILLGIAVGAINSVAGGGAILLYPVLQLLGVPLLMTNATVAASIWPGSLASAFGYRKYLKKLPKRYFLILLPCLLGAITGAILLRHTPDTKLKIILPTLVLFAVLLLSLQPKIHQYLFKRKAISRVNNPVYLITFSSLTFLISVYGGYFGAGFGIIMLALLGMTAIRSIHALNGLKNLTSFTITGVATIYFSYFNLIEWKYLPPLIIGTIIGGYLGSTFSTKIPTKTVRSIIILTGIIVAIYLFVK